MLSLSKRKMACPRCLRLMFEKLVHIGLAGP
jgi:hypothetical protein